MTVTGHAPFLTQAHCVRGQAGVLTELTDKISSCLSTGERGWLEGNKAFNFVIFFSFLLKSWQGLEWWRSG